MYSMNFFSICFSASRAVLKLLVKLRAVGNANDSGHESGDPRYWSKVIVTRAVERPGLLLPETYPLRHAEVNRESSRIVCETRHHVRAYERRSGRAA